MWPTRGRARPHRKTIILNSFDTLGLIAPLMKAIADAGYTIPTPIQAKAIQPILDGRDLLGIAQTGTGKTAAFALPILQRLAADPKPAPRKGCRVLVLSPTRELATQISESFRALGAHMGITVAVVFGGVSHRPQITALTRGVDVLVATPGRLLDHVAERNAVLNTTEVFVLDEADQMLDLGFFKPIRRIVAQLTTKRQSLFFSATMPAEIEALTKELLRDPIKVAVTPTATTVELIDQRVIMIEANRKRSLLVELLADAGMSRTLIFTRTKRGADRVAKHLDGAGINVSAIHGNKSQSQREAALDAFRDGNIRVLVATDIAARGIDVDKVTHVINFELPDVPEAYVHRIGRTARAGASGIAISLCGNEERTQLRDIERLTRKTIPAEDRRNDAGLAADAPGTSDRGGRRERSQGGGGRNGQRSARPSNGGERSHAPRRTGGGDRPHAGEARRDDRRAPQGASEGAHRNGSRDGGARHQGAQARPGRDNHDGRRPGSDRPAGERKRESRHQTGPYAGGQSYWEQGVIDRPTSDDKPAGDRRPARAQGRDAVSRDIVDRRNEPRSKPANGHNGHRNGQPRQEHAAPKAGARPRSSQRSGGRDQHRSTES